MWWISVWYLAAILIIATGKDAVQQNRRLLHFDCHVINQNIRDGWKQCRTQTSQLDKIRWYAKNTGHCRTLSLYKRENKTQGSTICLARRASKLHGNRINQSLFNQFKTVEEKPWMSVGGNYLLNDYVHLIKNMCWRCQSFLKQLYIQNPLNDSV